MKQDQTDKINHSKNYRQFMKEKSANKQNVVYVDDNTTTLRLSKRNANAKKNRYYDKLERSEHACCLLTIWTLCYYVEPISWNLNGLLQNRNFVVKSLSDLWKNRFPLYCKIQKVHYKLYGQYIMSALHFFPTFFAHSQYYLQVYLKGFPRIFEFSHHKLNREYCFMDTL